MRNNMFGSVRVCARVCPSVCLWVLSCLNRLTYDLDFLHEGRTWPWLAWDCRSRSYIKGQRRTVEPLVWSRSILGLGLPSSANGNCEWPLPVHWNCLFVSNHGSFNVSRSISFNYWSEMPVTSLYTIQWCLLLCPNLRPPITHMAKWTGMYHTDMLLSVSE